MRCVNPACRSTEIDFSEAGGDAVCVLCGTVCEESTIVSAIEFSENTTVVGQFVSASCTKPYKGKARYGFLRSSRETRLATGRRKIGQVASSLRLGSYYVDGAQRLFAMAAQRNFTQGRKALHVACACLYVMCRREKSAHMLIDFSDVLQVNVYALGSTFLKFRRLLNLELPIIDPSLYIHRFAAKLELGDKVAQVSTTALRVVQRMKRDWIETGRRPAGICAAALLIGARAHGFHRTQEEVVRALRVCGMTVSQRLADFERTPAAQLSLREFEEFDDSTEEHPPAFQRRLLLTAKKSNVERDRVYAEIHEMLQVEEAEQPERRVARRPIDDDGSDNFEDVEDHEIDDLILNEDEVATKRQVWTKLNKDYLAAQDEKDKLAKARAVSAEPKKRKTKQKPKKKKETNAAAAMMEIAEKKRFSKKINYAALVGIFGDDDDDIQGDKRQVVGGRGTHVNDRPQETTLDARDNAAPDDEDDDVDDYDDDDYDEEYD